MLYRCDQCGCYLDPGEGRTCEECRERIAARERRYDRMMQSIHADGAQYQMTLTEGVHNELI